MLLVVFGKIIKMLLEKMDEDAVFRLLAAQAGLNTTNPKMDKQSGDEKPQPLEKANTESGSDMQAGETG